jgi:hypothetical protein
MDTPKNDLLVLPAQISEMVARIMVMQEEVGHRLEAAALLSDRLGPATGFNGPEFRAASALGYWEAAADALRDLSAFVRGAEEADAEVADA